MANTKIKRVSKPRIEAIQAPKYSISLQLGDKTYTSSGETVLDALTALPTPLKIITKGFLTVEGEGKKFFRMFMPAPLKRFLWPVGRKIQAKMVAISMK